MYLEGTSYLFTLLHAESSSLGAAVLSGTHFVLPVCSPRFLKCITPHQTSIMKNACHNDHGDNYVQSFRLHTKEPSEAILHQSKSSLDGYPCLRKLRVE